MTFISCLFLALPLLLVMLFKNKYVGFATVLSAMVLGHTGIAFITQVLHVFTPSVVIAVHALIAIAVLMVMYKKRSSISFVPLRDMVLVQTLCIVFALGIVAYQLYAVHFDYTGPVSTISGEMYVSGDSYAYPLFSDEWIAVAVSRTVIAENALPLTHPFTGAPYQNYLVAFHALVAEIGILFSSPITTTYVWLGIVINTALVGMCFVVLRSLGVHRGVAVLGMLLVPYVVNGSNLPMLWYLLPWNVGFLVLLSTMVFVIHKQVWLALAAAFLSALLYPPIIVFSIPMLLTMCVGYESKIRNRILVSLGVFVLTAPIFFMGAVSIFTTYSFSEVSARFIEILIRPMFSSFGSVPTFFIWDVVPWVLLPFVVYAFWKYTQSIFFILVPVVIGLVGWVLNPITDTTFLIDYHRLVAMTALLLVIVGTLGVQGVWQYLVSRYNALRSNEIQAALSGVILIVFLILAPLYTTHDTWRKFTVPYRDQAGNTLQGKPASPVSRYLHPDDVRIFSALSGERFLAPSWKGLVIASITDNEPMYTKPSTITIRKVIYEDFSVATCEQKMAMVRAHRVSYIYAEKINCAGFEVIDQSAEGLYLSRVASS
jgi:hypothetical protein